MATTTPNFGWPVPTSTDLVKDGATAIEALGDSIDASLLDLKGGTTGQVLSKTTNTDMDFTWVTSDDANAIQNTIVDAKGDLIAATAADTPARLAVGTNGQFLTADSTAATGLAWAAAPAAASMTSIASGSVPTGTTTLSLTSISGSYTHLQLVVYAWNGSGNNIVSMRLNNDTGSNYAYSNLGYSAGASRNASVINQTSFNLTNDAAVSGNNKNVSVINIPFYTDATTGKTINSVNGYLDSTSTRAVMSTNGYYYGTNAAVTRIDFIYGSNWSGGSYVLYGVK